jgi:hypothetical protein
MLEVGRKMLEICSASHTACKGSTFFTALPTRVIDVGDNQTAPFLYIPKGRFDRYCALSYCWGSDSGWYNTTKENISERTRSLPFVLKEKPIPRTYHDAIITTRTLGIRYLWIDAICIIQDEAEDWQRESSKMREIYQNAYCTIAATGSKHANDGFLNERPGEKFMPRGGSVRFLGGYVEAPSPDRTRLIDNAPLSRRGWVLQEALLSPRTLHWTAHCLYYECPAGQSTEGGGFESVSSPRLSRFLHREAIINSKKLLPDKMHQIWYALLGEYTKRELTKKKIVCQLFQDSQIMFNC